MFDGCCNERGLRSRRDPCATPKSSKKNFFFLAAGKARRPDTGFHRRLQKFHDHQPGSRKHPGWEPEGSEMNSKSSRPHWNEAASEIGRAHV